MKKNKSISKFFVLAITFFSVAAIPVIAVETNAVDDQTSSVGSVGFAGGRHQGQNRDQLENGGLRKAAAGIGSQNFCSKFSASSTKYVASVNDQLAKLQSRIDTESQKVQVNRQDSDAALKQDKEKAVQNRQAIYAALSVKATTDAQKQAVATFQTTLEAAVAAREAAVDAAKVTYRQGLDQALLGHQTSMKDYLATFKSAIQAAIDQANSQCSAGTDPATVKKTFQNAMQAARTARKSDIQQKVEVGPQLQQLAQTRNAAIQSAMQTYQTAMKSAIETLRAAFGESASADAQIE